MRLTRTLGLLGALLLTVTSSSAQVTLQPRLGEPLSGLTPAQLDSFFAGKLLFGQVFVAGEGLGPIFNDDSCGGCHSDPVVGGSGSTLVTRFGRAPKGEPFDPLAELGGSLLQSNAISDDCREELPPEATVVANRVTPLALGLGLIEEIPDSDLVNIAASGNGKVHMVPLLEDPMAPMRVGRFGWKAQLATVMSFSGDASLEEMGLTNPILSQENAPNGDLALLGLCDAVPDFPETEVDQQFLDDLTAFQRLSAPPPQTPRSGMTGEQVFIDTGCAECHVATSFTTGLAPEAALTGVSFKPYSDFLLHDVGSLGDGIVQGEAFETEIRTPALWGVRFRDPLLHDGRVIGGNFSTRIDEAVNFHGGDAIDSVDAFNALSDTQRDQLVAFLDSLGRREFDVDGDNVVFEEDYRSFRDCFTGDGAGTITADDPCAVHDVDQDGDVDLADFDLFLTVYIGAQEDCDGNGEIDLVDFLTGAAEDCNDNLVPDECDIASGDSLDVDLDMVPDECVPAVQFVRSDCNADGAADLADSIFLLGFLFSSGTTPSCEDACDLNSDGGLDIADAIYGLDFLFSGGTAPAAPFPDCGPQDAGATLTCENFMGCP